MNLYYDKTFIIDSAFTLQAAYTGENGEEIRFNPEYDDVFVAFTNIENDVGFYVTGVGTIRGNEILVRCGSEIWQSAPEGFFKNDISDIYGYGGVWHAYSVWIRNKNNDKYCVLRGKAKLVKGADMRANLVPDYWAVRPNTGVGGGNTGENNNSGGNAGSGSGGDVNVWDHLTELEKIIEDYLNKEYTFDNVNLRDKLKGVIKDVKELKTEVKAVNDKIQAIVTTKDVAVTTDNEALAQAIQQINAKFGEINASINELKQSYTSKDQALAQKFDELKATLPNADDLSTQIMRNVETKINRAVDGKTSSITSDLSRLSTTVSGQNVKIDNASTIATQAKDYAARVKSVVTDSRGRITGWSYGDGSNQQSKFEINADNFRITDSLRSLTPFEISGGKIKFGADVSFDQLKQTNTIIKIERYENNSSSSRTIYANFSSDSNACIVLWGNSDGSKSGVSFLGRNGYGGFHGSFIMPPNTAAIMLYLNQEDLR